MGGTIAKAIMLIVKAIYNFRSIQCNFSKQYYALAKISLPFGSMGSHFYSRLINSGFLMNKQPKRD